MSKKLYEENDIRNIANSIRTKTKTTDTMKVSEMATKINSIPISDMNVTPRSDWKVIFVDIDGEILWEGFVPDGGTIPFNQVPIPEHEELTFIQWNQTDTIANHENYYDDGLFKTIVIGPEYDLTRDADGNLPPTTFTLMVNGDLAVSYAICLKASASGGITIDWGDGSTSAVSKTSGTTAKSSHTYTTSGLYKIKILCNDGYTYKIVGTSSSSYYSPNNFYKGFRKAIIGKGCTGLGSYSFYLTYSLRELYISSECTTVAASCIYQCLGLHSLSLSRSVTNLSYNSFCYRCDTLKSIIIPSSVTTMNASCFTTDGNLSAVTYISIPKTITSMSSTCLWGYYPKYVSSNINRVENVTGYGWRFYTSPYDVYCENQPQISAFRAKCNPYVHNVLAKKSSNNSTYSYGFCDCKALREATIEDGTVILNTGLFAGSNSLYKVTIPSSVKTLGDSLFNFNTQLTEINFPEGTTTTGAPVFKILHLEHFTIPSTWPTLYSNCFREIYSLRKLTIPSTVTAINGYSFYTCTGLEDLVEPNSVTTRGNYVWQNNYSLRYIKLSDNVGYIQSGTFVNCYGLQTIDFGNTRTTIPAFGASASSTTAGTTSYITVTGLCFIIVPDSLYDSWYNASNWATFKTYLIKYSDYYKHDDGSGNMVGLFDDSEKL